MGIMTNLWTIGFTKTTAEHFFESLRQSGARRVVDVRLNNVSQLAGFAKKQDLPYFLRKICSMEYQHVPILAPTHDLLDAYRKRQLTWSEYEYRFLRLLEEREVEKTVSPDLLLDSCMLCSEDKPDRCHRRLVAEYLSRHWDGIEVHHLV